jgi:RND family efflux transporter MFP subunit
MLQGLRVAYIGPAGDDALLAQVGAAVDRFASPEEAFGAILERDYGVILVNLQAAGGSMGAPELVRLVRSCGHPLKSRIPIIGLASPRQMQFAEKLRAVGIDALLGTPVDVGHLASTLAGSFAGGGAVAQQPSVAPPRRAPGAGQGSAAGAVAPPLGGFALSGGQHGVNAPVPLAEHGADMYGEDADRKGLLERLGDKILARLAKNGAAAPSDDGRPSSSPLEGFGAPQSLAFPTLPTAQPPPAPRAAPLPTPSPQPSSRAAVPAPRATAPATALPGRGARDEAPRSRVPAAQAAPSQSARASAAIAASQRERLLARANADRASPGRETKRSGPYVSRLNRRPLTSPPAAAKSPNAPLAGTRQAATVPRRPTGEAQSADTGATGAASYRLTDAERNRVYDRVRKLVSTARRAAQDGEGEGSVEGSVPQKSLKVCFLEDSCTSSHAIREMLGERGHEVDHFSSAEEALDAVAEKRYDVLLASQIVALGGMDCAGLINSVRRLPDVAKRQMPIVAITASSEQTDIQRFLGVGADDVIVKPVAGQELHGRLQKAVTARAAPVARPQAARRVKVCFLEDSCTSSHAIREMLGDAGHEVDHFSSPEEALDALMEKDYDLLLASQIVALGGMDCEKLIRTLRSAKQPGKQNLPVLAITANPDKANVEQFYAAGANDVLIKPIEGKALNERVQEVVTVKAAPAARTAPPALPAKHLRVCFLEDSCTSSHAIREMLGEAGHEVDHFSTAEEALDAFQEKDYDVLLASQLPALGGLDTEGLVRRVRQGKGARKAIVLLTTDGSNQNQQHFRRAGVNDIIVKPVEGNLSQRLVDVVARKPQAQPRPAQRQPPKRAVPEKLRVCFLEDSCTSSHAIREMLGESGHEVDHFSSAEEALDAFMEKPYDVLLASQIVALGGLGCEDMIRAVRGAAVPLKRQAPVVVLTADSQPENIARFRRSGADAVVVKPIEGSLSEQLKDVVGRVYKRGAAQPTPPSSGAQRPAAASAARPAKAPGTTRPAVQMPPVALSPGQPTPPVMPMPAVGSPARTTPGEFPGGLSAFEQSSSGMPAFDFKVSGAEPALGGMPQDSRGGGGGQKDRKVIIGMAVAGVITLLVATWHHFGDAVPVDLVTADQGPIFESINAPGQVVSKKRVELTSGMPGQIVKVNVKEGDSVTRGQVLAVMDDRSAMVQVQRAEANLDSAKKEVALNERTLDRLVRALQMGAVSRQMAEDAEAAVHAARAKQRVAAEEYRAAQLVAERLSVLAPFEGVVTVSYAVEGLWAEPPGPLFQLVDMSQREVELKIPAEQVARLNVGQKVNLTSDAFPGHEWVEQIVRVAPATSREGGMANTLSVYTSMGGDAPPLRFGQQVDAQIRTAGSDRATRLPLGAVTLRNGRPAVAVIDGEFVRFRAVTTGVESFTQVEIRDGLKPGDKVILLNKPLEEGAKVSPVELPG